MKIQFSFLLAPGNDETAMLKVKYLKMFNYSESITNTSLCRSNAQVLLVKTSDVSIYVEPATHGNKWPFMQNCLSKYLHRMIHFE